MNITSVLIITILSIIFLCVLILPVIKFRKPFDIFSVITILILFDFISLLLTIYTCTYSCISRNNLIFWIALSMMMFSFLIPYIFLKLTSYRAPFVAKHVVDKKNDNISYGKSPLNTFQDTYEINNETNREDE